MVELDFEDPATGSAAASLTSYLSLKGDADETRYHIIQGVELGRKSDIETHVVSKAGLDGTRVIKEVRLGGTAKVVMKGEIFL
jgi:pre-mRNA-processing factor 19